MKGELNLIKIKDLMLSKNKLYFISLNYFFVRLEAHERNVANGVSVGNGLDVEAEGQRFKKKLSSCSTFEVLKSSLHISET
jgi:hypothetical protein